MIPLKLRMCNFMCYRQVDNLDFSGIHLACLAGDNGHGKSALLDAMTWALWGKARARSDDELIYLGQTEMEVEFEFELSGNRYRIIRKRKSGKRGRSVLEFQVQSKGQFRALTEPTMRDTQAGIDVLLRMDYDTFINSAFLLQGRADEFTVKPPAERKRILGEILGLSIYDQYEERAKERAKERDREAAQIAARIEEMERELERQPEYQREMKQAQNDVDGLSAALRSADEELKGLREEVRAIEFKQTQIDELEDRIAQARRELDELKASIAQSEERLKGYEKVMADQQYIQEGFAALTMARFAKETLDNKRLELAELNERRAALESAIETARQGLRTERRMLAEQVGELEARAGRITALESELAEVRQHLERLEGLEAERERQREESQNISTEATGLETRNQQIASEGEALEEKVRLLEKAEARCPLCDSELSEDDRERLVAQFQEERQAGAELLRQNEARIEELNAHKQALREEIEALGRELDKRAGLQRQEATQERELAEARQAADTLIERRADLIALDTRLDQGQYAAQEQAALAELGKSVEALGYDPEEHEQVRRDIEVLSRFDEEWARLQTALEHTDQERANLERLRNSQGRWQEGLRADIEKQEALSKEVTRLAEVRQELQRKEAEVEELHSAEARARLVLGAARQKLEHCRYLAQERKRKVENREKVIEEKAIYEELRLAFGKKGVQAMIIESVIPEIEDEANALLSRMTDNRMHVRFETQRETKKGDTVETLDIKISDELGTRSYQMFSGGEAFRANFAIRIALSKLLARRAGARLQTLVIDEGFGTQDTQGRERLVEAINSIQDDFEKVIVITHIEELKDAFPVRIDVTKTPQGSEITLN